MKNKLLILFLFVFINNLYLKANMGDPVWEGIPSVPPFANQFVEITHEDLYITIDNDANYVSFKATYFINSLKDGINIPLLFLASDYEEHFMVKYDSKVVYIKEIPDNIKIVEESKFKDFAYNFKFDSIYEESISIFDDLRHENSGQVRLSDLKYFEILISKGNHIIEVSYNAERGYDGWDWIKKYMIRYSLYPAKSWKSFGTLIITVDTKNSVQTISTNLGQPSKGNIYNIAQWEFDKIPVDIIQINYTPKVSYITRLLSSFGPEGFAILFLFVLGFWHFTIVRKYRKKHLERKVSGPVFVGSFFIPLIVVIFYLKLYQWFPYLIGQHSSEQYNDYMILSGIFYYIIIVPVYLVVLWIIDLILERKNAP